MSFTALQGATLIAVHATFTKVLLSFTLRIHQFMEGGTNRAERVEMNFHIQQYQKAQINESEYAGLLTAVLFCLSLKNSEPSMGATMAVVGQIGYVWIRSLFGYPTIPTITLAMVRYGGLTLLLSDLWKTAF